MIFVDSNIPMYLVGSAHPNKVDAQRLLERIIADRERLVTDAEVLQEILHRYVAVDRKDAIQPAFDAILGIVDGCSQSIRRVSSALNLSCWEAGDCLPEMPSTSR